jgi:hypothetical protein
MTRTRGLTLVLVLLMGSAVGYWIWPWAGTDRRCAGIRQQRCARRTGRAA